MGFANLTGIARPSSVTVLKRARTPLAFPAILTSITDGIPRPDKFKWDAVFGQSMRDNWNAPTHPVEDGPDITDHIRKDLQVVQISGMVSDTSLSPSAGFGLLGELNNRALEEIRKLREMADSGETVFLATSMGVLESANIMNIERTRNAPGQAGVGVSVTFREARIVSPLDVPQVEDLDALLFGAQGTVSQGQLAATPAIGFGAI